MLSVFLAHAPADADFARELTSFLEAGCDDLDFTPDSVILTGHDLIDTAEMGKAADVLIVLISPASNPSRWVREKWEPVLTDSDARVAIVLIEECTFPPLLRRGLNFFDATKDRLASMRRLKRWLGGIQFGTCPAMTFSRDLEPLYEALADKPGTLTAAGELAERFSHQAERDFATVVWIPAHGKTLTQIVGELGSQLEVMLDGQIEDNCHKIRDVLSNRRCLIVLDGLEVSAGAFLPTGRTSVVYTDKPMRLTEYERSFATARCLVVARRFAEAYELLYQLMDAGIEPESCARELVWICEHWDRIDEANALRFRCPSEPSEQLRLF